MPLVSPPFTRASITPLLFTVYDSSDNTLAYGTIHTHLHTCLHSWLFRNSTSRSSLTLRKHQALLPLPSLRIWSVNRHYFCRTTERWKGFLESGASIATTSAELRSVGRMETSGITWIWQEQHGNMVKHGFSHITMSLERAALSFLLF